MTPRADMGRTLERRTRTLLTRQKHGGERRAQRHSRPFHAPCWPLLLEALWNHSADSPCNPQSLGLGEERTPIIQRVGVGGEQLPAYAREGPGLE